MALKQLLLGTIFDTATDPNAVSLSFNGIFNTMQQGGAPFRLGVTDLTFLRWSKQSVFVAGTKGLLVTDVGASVQRSEIQAFTTSTGDIQFQLWDDQLPGSIMKDYTWNAIWALDVWTLFGITWTNTGSVLRGFFQGVAVAPSVQTVDLAGMREDAEAFLFMGVPGGPLNPAWAGLIHWDAWWDTALPDSAILAIFNGKSSLDLLTNSGSYLQSANLINWWRWGTDPTNIGRNFGPGDPFSGQVSLFAFPVTPLPQIVNDAP